MSYHIVQRPWMLNDCESDIWGFKNLTKSGQFYDQFRDILRAEGYPIDRDAKKSRDQAKAVMFRVAFAKSGDKHPGKMILKRHFPDLVAIMDGFKKDMVDHYREQGEPDAVDNGNAALAVLLQTVESGIFIGGILERLLRESYRVFTKHDSVLCKKSDLADVYRIVSEELDRYLGAGGYVLEIEKKSTIQ